MYTLYWVVSFPSLPDPLQSGKRLLSTAHDIVCGHNNDMLFPCSQTMSGTKILWSFFLLGLLTTHATAQGDQHNEESEEEESYPPCVLPLQYPARIIGREYTVTGDGNSSCASELARSETLASISNDTREIIKNLVLPIIRQDEFCNMDIPCGGPGWRLHALLNASNPSNDCPAGFRYNSDPPSCIRDSDERGCTSAFSSGFHDVGPYDQVCGIIFAYQYFAPNAFEPYNNNVSLTLEDPYVDGVSLTYGVPGNRQHLWTWAAASSELDSGPTVCPCTNDIAPDTIQIPPFVRTDYFCETGVIGTPEAQWYEDDPLWEGRGCGFSTCCDFNRTPNEQGFPIFERQLPSPTTDPLEVRLCRDEAASTEDVGIALMVIFVR